MKRSSLKRGRRRTLTAEEREAAGLFHAFAQRSGCAVCSMEEVAHFDPHHVVEAQELRKRGLDEWDVRNCLPLCRLCHDRHTSAFHRVPFRKLRPENISYAYEVLGDFASDYLRRRYPMDETGEQT